MKAYIDVTDHPYHTVTDADGAYEIRDLPPASYTVRIWHEALGTLDRRLPSDPAPRRRSTPATRRRAERRRQ